MVIALLDEAARLARPWLQNIVESHGLINQENRIARIFFCLMTGLRLIREILFASATITRRSTRRTSGHRSSPAQADDRQDAPVVVAPLRFLRKFLDILHPFSQKEDTERHV
jgi:hypothetical protein